MTTRKQLPDDEEKQTASSQGRQSKSVTPKDVDADDATARDVRERKTASDDADEKLEEQLDDAVDMTFPASDPIAIPDPDKADKLNRQRAR